MEKILRLKEFILEKKLAVIMIASSLIIIVIVIILVLSMLTNQSNMKEDDINLEQQIAITEDNTNIEPYVVVDIKGEVENPGLYQVNADGRVFDAITMAGGITKNADTSVLNLSKKIYDEMVIVVYSKEEVKKYKEVKQEEAIKIDNCPKQTEITNNACIESNDLVDSNISIVDNQLIEIEPLPDQILDSSNDLVSEKDKNNQLISINKASIEELITLPGIGESKAKKIIAYREEVGSFKLLEELKNVSGIGDSIFEKIKPYITL